MVKILFIEGNIGSGKTSSLEYLKNRLRRVPEDKQPIFMLEPVEQWQNLPTLEGQPVNLLNAFYKDIPKYGFCFQTYAFLSRMKILLESVRKAEQEGRQWVICERSIFTDREIFLECLFENGSVENAERAVYHHLWDFWIALLQPFFKNVEVHFLYLNCNPDVALEHIAARNRDEEKDVDLDYLRKLHLKHDNFYLPEGDQSDLLKKLIGTLTGDSETPPTIHIVNNGDSMVELYAQLDRVMHEHLLAEEPRFGMVDPKKIWAYWDFFWDVN